MAATYVSVPLMVQDPKQTGITLTGTLSAGAITTTGALTVSGGTATGAALAATLNAQAGVITTESLATAGAARATYTITNSYVTAASRILVQLQQGTNTTRPVVLTNVQPGAGSFTVDIENLTSATALNGTLKIHFLVA